MFLLTVVVYLYMQRYLCALIPELLHSPSFYILHQKKKLYFYIYEKNPNRVGNNIGLVSMLIL